jgi:uncharacterized protein YgbK (DUF1537 family)
LGIAETTIILADCDAISLERFLWNALFGTVRGGATFGRRLVAAKIRAAPRRDRRAERSRQMRLPYIALAALLVLGACSQKTQEHADAAANQATAAAVSAAHDTEADAKVAAAKAKVAADEAERKAKAGADAASNTK